MAVYKRKKSSKAKSPKKGIKKKSPSVKIGPGKKRKKQKWPFWPPIQ